MNKINNIFDVIFFVNLGLPPEKVDEFNLNIIQQFGESLEIK